MRGYQEKEVEKVICEILDHVIKALDSGLIRPNQGNGFDHVLNIIGGSVRCQESKVQIAIENTLKDLGVDYFKAIDSGNFLCRI